MAKQNEVTEAKLTEAIDPVVEVVTEPTPTTPAPAVVPVDIAGNPIQATSAQVLDVQRVASGDEVAKQAVVEAKLSKAQLAPPPAPSVAANPNAPQDAFSSLTQLSPIASMVVSNLRDYIVKMRPGAPMTVTEGVKHQSLLSRTLKMLINNVQGEEFSKLFTAVLASFAEHRRGVFGEKAVFRFPEYQTESASDRAAFQSLLAMLILLAPIPTRPQALKQVSLVRVLDFPMFTDAGRFRVMNFFGQ